MGNIAVKQFSHNNRLFQRRVNEDMVDLFRYLASTIFVPTYARMSFPCFDEPALKAEFTLTVLRKPDFIALSNMPIDNSTRR